jgi:hypothetical protein
MSGDICLNCGAPVTGKFCSQCGQKKETHRFTIGHLLAHDLVHGMFHLDKVFPYTAKKLFTRPGYAVREYIEGKRISYFNPVTFLLLVIAANLSIQLITGFSYANLFGIASKNASTMEQVQHFLQKNYKPMILVTLPFISLCTWLVFRKARQNYAEHLVMNTYKESASLIISTVFFLVMSISKDPGFQRIVFGLSGLTVNIYNIRFYWQFYKADYNNKFVLGLSIIALFLLYMILITSFVYVIIMLFLKNVSIH